MLRDEHVVDTYDDEYETGGLEGTAAGKLLARAPGLDAETFLARVADVVDGRAELGSSGAIGLAELTPRGVTKASALQETLPPIRIETCMTSTTATPMAKEARAWTCWMLARFTGRFAGVWRS